MLTLLPIFEPALILDRVFIDVKVAYWKAY